MFLSFLLLGVPMYALASARLWNTGSPGLFESLSAKDSEPLGAPLTTEYMRQLSVSWPLDWSTRPTW